uniref:INO80 complex subunit D-like n=1 Tax=Rhizophora mucronata TaxID=61149 RepID=A0A2P2M0Z4_RHIMU
MSFIHKQMKIHMAGPAVTLVQQVIRPQRDQHPITSQKHLVNCTAFGLVYTVAHSPEAVSKVKIPAQLLLFSCFTQLLLFSPFAALLLAWI